MSKDRSPSPAGRGPLRRGLARFHARAAAPETRWDKAFAVVVTPLLALAISDARGPVLGAIAFVVYGSLFVGTAFAKPTVIAWSARHPVLDTAWIVPLLALALALVPSLPLRVCLAAGLVAWVLLAPLRIRVLRRGARRRADSPT